MRQQRHIGVYALILLGDQVLLIKKARGAYRGKWDLPGGGLEFGETARDGLAREVLEETGLEVQQCDLREILTQTTVYKKDDGEEEELYHIGIIYAVRVQRVEENLKTDSDGEDSDGASWQKISDINERNASPFAMQSIRSLV